MNGGPVYSSNTAPFFLDMKHGLPLFLFFTVFAGSLALSQSSTAAAANKPPAKKAVPKKASAAKKPTSAKTGKTAKKPAVAAVTGRNRQMEPTPERYKEIQRALVDKGYLKSEPNGVWDPESTDALLRFQTDRKLSPTGKLSSASLIALGLGPKTSADAQVQPPAPVETPPVAPEN
jgi:hypothetical protein